MTGLEFGHEFLVFLFRFCFIENMVFLLVQIGAGKAMFTAVAVPQKPGIGAVFAEAGKLELVGVVADRAFIAKFGLSEEKKIDAVFDADKGFSEVSVFPLLAVKNKITVFELVVIVGKVAVYIVAQECESVLGNVDQKFPKLPEERAIEIKLPAVFHRIPFIGIPLACVVDLKRLVG